MKSGIIRRVDSLGRIVLPMELRKSLRLREGTTLELSLENDKIVLTKCDVGRSIKELASAILGALPQRLNRFIVCDNEKVVATNKLLKCYDGVALEETVFDLPLRSFESKADEFSFDDKYPFRYISSILKDGDRLGFVVCYSESEIDSNMRDFTEFISGIISRQV